jgi:hypothetical protein
VEDLDLQESSEMFTQQLARDLTFAGSAAA